MNRSCLPLLLFISVWFSTLMACADEREIFFASKVKPLLAARCLSCHGRDEKDLRGGLDLRSLNALRAGGDSGEPAIVPGSPERSPLILAVTRQSETWSAMPPKENDRLSPAEVEVLRKWIADGAVWSDQTAPEIPESGQKVVTSGGLDAAWTARPYQPENLWAYRPLSRPEVPASTILSHAGTHPVDAFLAVRMTAQGILPAGRASRRALIRRATFDLLGLPPAPEEVEAFVNDPASDQQAFATVVERLLASPHYGEQLARHWLDVVRYADSSGFANDYERGNAWRYRDYVVRAFNCDKPYDRFVREQLAGDELDETDPESLIAVGFLRMGPWELTGMEVARVARQRFLDDVTDIVGQTFLAHAMQCARCHDHKFDPIPTRDYYGLQAVFATTQLVERPAGFTADENTRGFDEQQSVETKRQWFDRILKELSAKEQKAARQWAAERGLEYVPRAEGLRRGVPEEQLPPRHIGLDTTDLGMERVARKGLERLNWLADRYRPVALSVYSGRTPELKAVYAPLRLPADRLEKGELEATHILSGGDPFSPGEAVQPSVLSAVNSLSESPDFAALTIPGTITGRRRALADWIVSERNPLTARVMVNRIWQWHFGRAIVTSPNNFGATGQKPTHPELLDWLAAEFVARNWSIKAMHRQIMSSEAYARSTQPPDADRLKELDPHGTSLAMFPPRTLSAEELRDAMLAVSGELNREIGGIPVRPEINREVAFQPRQVMGTFAPVWEPSPRPEQRHRRSLYALQLRGLRDPQMEVFNQPSPDLSCEVRGVSTITPQVFALFNSESSAQRSLALAARLIRETSSPPAAIDRAFALAFGREPSESERRACLEHWSAMTERHRTLNFEPQEQPKEVLREAVEENTGERFRYVEPLSSAEQFVPDLQSGDVDAETRALADVCLVLFNTNEFSRLD